MIKHAVLSMDVEDWYHLHYFKDKADPSYSMLDGFTNYIELLNRHQIKTTFFVLSELADRLKSELLYAVSCGHEIACHGKGHTRPVELDAETFERELTEAKATLEDVVGKQVIGYRAPCYGIDNDRYSVLQRVGFKYSSSKMDVPGHSLYGRLDLTGFEQPVKGIYTKDGMTEFSLSTQKVFGKHIAISGGGWIRLLPWEPLMKPLIQSYLKDAESYTLYIHPFELSSKQMPRVPDAGMLTNLRARKGLGKVERRINQLIEMLRGHGFTFLPFSALVGRETFELVGG